MKIICPDCKAAYNVSDDKIPAGEAKGKCKCGSILKLRRDVALGQAASYEKMVTTEETIEGIRQIAIAHDRPTQFRLWSLIQEPPERLTNQLPLFEAEVKNQDENEKEALTLTAEEKAKKVIEIATLGPTKLEREQKRNQRMEEWRSLYAQSPEQARNLLKMWAETYNAKSVMCSFSLASGQSSLSDQKFEEWQSLYHQSPEQAMDFLKMVVREIVLINDDDDDFRKDREEAGKEIERIYGYFDPYGQKFEEWRFLYSKSPKQAANLLKIWDELQDAYNEIETELLPSNIPCSRCGSTADIIEINNERTAGKYECLFCNKTTIHRSHQNPAKRRREAITESVRVAIMSRAGQCCEICGSDQNLHIDHVVPFSKGGSNDMKNLQLLCRDCNLRKGGN